MVVAVHPDIPPLPEAFFKKAAVWHPQPKVLVTVDLDVDILEWFKREAVDWESRIQPALRLYVEANEAYLRSREGKKRSIFK